MKNSAGNSTEKQFINGFDKKIEYIDAVLTLIYTLVSIYFKKLSPSYFVIVAIVIMSYYIKRLSTFYIVCRISFLWLCIYAGVSDGIIEQEFGIYTFIILSIFLGIISTGGYHTKIQCSKERVCLFLCSIFITYLFFGFQLYGKFYLTMGEYSIYYITVTFVLIRWSYVFLYSVTRIIKHYWSSIRFCLCDKSNERTYVDVLKMRVLLFLTMTISGLLFSILYYPGVITADNLYVYKTVNEIGDISVRTDIHSFAFVLLEKLLFSICDHFYFVTIIFVLLFALSWSMVFSYLYKKGLRRKTTLAISLLWLLIPQNLYLIIATWKDIPFSICMLLMAFCILKYIGEGEKAFFLYPFNYVLFILSSLGVGLFRSNGIGVILITLIAIIIYSFPKKKIKIIIVSATTIGLLFFIRIPVYNLLGVQQTPEYYMAYPFINGVWECSFNGDNLSPEIERLIDKHLITIEKFNDEYKLSYFNDNAFYDVDDYNLNYKTLSLSEAQSAYFWCLKNHPASVILARMKKTYNLWSVFENDDYPLNRNYRDSEFSMPAWGEKYIVEYNTRYAYARNRFSRFFSDGSNKYILGEFIDLITRNGFNLIIWIISFIGMLSGKNIKYIFVILPAVANTITLLFACCFQDWRYMYPMEILTWFYAFAIITFCQRIS